MSNILIFNSFYYPFIRGGAEISTKLFAEGIKNEFTNVYVITTGDQKENKIIREEINNVTIIRVPHSNIYWLGNLVERNVFTKTIWHLINNYNLRMNKMIKQLIEEINPSVIHTQNLMGIGTCVWSIAKKKKIPIVHTIRDYSLIAPVNNNAINKFLSTFNKSRSKHVDYVVGISNYILEEHTKYGFFNKGRNRVIHNVVESQKYLQKSYTQDSKPLKLGYFGQLEENKGIDILLEALFSISPRIVDQVVVLGEGSLKQTLMEKTKKDNRVIFKGKVSLEEVYGTMASCDLTIVPSKWPEPFGRVIIESFRQGTPVIAANVGGIPEIIPDKAKYIFTSEDSNSLREKIIQFYQLDKDKKNQEISNVYNESLKYSENLSYYREVYKSINVPLK